MPCATFSMLDGPSGTSQFHRDRQALKMMHMFLQSEVNQLIQHIIVQDQDGQNNNTKTDIKEQLV